MDTLLQIISALFLVTGSFLCISGGVGILRFPDFYTRMHAAGVTDTLATAMILIGLMLIESNFMVDIKLLIIMLMTMFISPTTSHALAKAAHNNQLKPKLDESSDNK